jgi:flagellar basal-body rod modification protein FlgD
MKNEEFVAQLAQFSQLEATYGMSASLEEMAKSQRSEQLMQGAVLVGKDVFAQTGLISTDGENASELHFDLPNGADQLEIGIFDASSNQRIRNMVIGPQQPGTAELAWDGKLPGGVSAPAGQYIVRASVTQSGVTAPITPKTYSSVKSIGWDASTAELNVDFGNNISLPISSVNRVGQF